MSTVDRGDADPAAASLRGPVAAGAGQHAPARRGGAAGGAARWQQAADPGGVDRPGAAGRPGTTRVAGDAGVGRGSAGRCPCWCRAFPPAAADGREQAARKSPCKEDNRAACPAQSAAGSGSGATPGPDRASFPAAGGSGDVAAGPPDRQGSRGRQRAGRRTAMSESGKITASHRSQSGRNLRPPVHPRPGGAEHRVDRPPVRPGQPGPSAGLAARTRSGSSTATWASPGR